MYGNARRLYVLETEDGVIKAGIASRAGESRIDQHRRSVKVKRHFIAEGFVTGIDAERELLARLGAIGSVIRGREWFAGIEFEAAKQIAQEVARQFINPNPAPRTERLRVAITRLNFNDNELAILDAYCRRVGKERAVACRELALDAIVEMLCGSPVHGKNFGRATT
jgi:hypothetical protein